MGSQETKNGQLEIVNLKSWTWETRKSYFTEVHGFATLVYKENMFVFGRLSNELGTNLDTIQSYDSKTDTWTDRGNLLSSHYFHDVIFSSGVFLVFGDTNGRTKTEKCDFDESTLFCEGQSTYFGSVD